MRNVVSPFLMNNRIPNNCDQIELSANVHIKNGVTSGCKTIQCGMLHY